MSILRTFSTHIPEIVVIVMMTVMMIRLQQPTTTVFAVSSSESDQAASKAAQLDTPPLLAQLNIQLQMNIDGLLVFKTKSETLSKGLDLF